MKGPGTGAWRSRTSSRVCASHSAWALWFPRGRTCSSHRGPHEADQAGLSRGLSRDEGQGWVGRGLRSPRFRAETPRLQPGHGFTGLRTRLVLILQMRRRDRRRGSRLRSPGPLELGSQPTGCPLSGASGSLRVGAPPGIGRPGTVVNRDHSRGCRMPTPPPRAEVHSPPCQVWARLGHLCLRCCAPVGATAPCLLCGGPWDHVFWGSHSRKAGTAGELGLDASSRDPGPHPPSRGLQASSLRS